MNRTLAGDGSESRPDPAIPSQRWQRIADYERAALENPDALVANLGVLSADMMWLESHIMTCLRAALDRTAPSPEALTRFLPAIQISAQLARQVQRFADFARRLEAGPSSALPPRSSRGTSAAGGPGDSHPAPGETRLGSS
jgi:hypothetical protein